MNISGLDEFSFQCPDSDIVYKATKQQDGNWGVRWEDYDGALQYKSYLYSKFDAILKSWAAKEVDNG